MTYHCLVVANANSPCPFARVKNESRQEFLNATASGSIVGLVLTDGDLSLLIADLVAVGVREISLVILGAWPGLVFDPRDFQNENWDWSIVVFAPKTWALV